MNVKLQIHNFSDLTIFVKEVVLAVLVVAAEVSGMKEGYGGYGGCGSGLYGRYNNIQ